jgi:metal-sulfur cluster biosynthetic enzyme
VDGRAPRVLGRPAITATLADSVTAALKTIIDPKLGHNILCG